MSHDSSLFSNLSNHGDAMVPDCNSSTILMPVPNPKRSIPANFFNLQLDDPFPPYSYAPKDAGTPEVVPLSTSNQSYVEQEFSTSQQSKYNGDAFSGSKIAGDCGISDPFEKFYSESFNESSGLGLLSNNVKDTSPLVPSTHLFRTNSSRLLGPISRPGSTTTSQSQVPPFTFDIIPMINSTAVIKGEEVDDESGLIGLSTQEFLTNSASCGSLFVNRGSPELTCISDGHNAAMQNFSSNFNGSRNIFDNVNSNNKFDDSILSKFGTGRPYSNRVEDSILCDSIIDDNRFSNNDSNGSAISLNSLLRSFSGAASAPPLQQHRHHHSHQQQHYSDILNSADIFDFNNNSLNDHTYSSVAGGASSSVHPSLSYLSQKQQQQQQQSTAQWQDNINRIGVCTVPSSSVHSVNRLSTINDVDDFLFTRSSNEYENQKHRHSASFSSSSILNMNTNGNYAAISGIVRPATAGIDTTSASMEQQHALYKYNHQQQLQQQHPQHHSASSLSQLHQHHHHQRLHSYHPCSDASHTNTSNIFFQQQSTLTAPLSPLHQLHMHHYQQQQQFVIEPGSVEDTVSRSCKEILSGAADHSLKAVELANTLRARVGTESLARIRERWGGLLALLEKQPSFFRVDRIPKNDKVTLQQPQQQQALSQQLENTTINTSRSNIDENDSDGGIFISNNATVDERNNNNSFNNDNHAYGDSSTSPTNTTTDALNPTSSNECASSSALFNSNNNSSCNMAAAATSAATRCLHVGNVPANLSEVQLMREFEKFGHLDGLKLVSQRNGSRRFAFVTFHTVEQAITARHCLLKLHPWKSAISFAYKDFGQQQQSLPTSSSFQQQQQHNTYSTNSSNTNNSVYSGGSNSKNNSSSSHYQQQQLQPLMYQTFPTYPNEVVETAFHTHSYYSSNVNNNDCNSYYDSCYGGGCGWEPPKPHWPQRNATPHLEATTASTSSVGATNVAANNVDMVEFPFINNKATSPESPSSSSSLSIPTTASTSIGDASLSFSQHHQLSRPKQQQQQQQQQLCPVLRRLCDDTYVPTQPWPVDLQRDRLYCNAVVAQLQQFGGYTTVSKLRGFLRNRIAAVDNIKSVPLKAMLSAYPLLFVLENNYVSLASHAGGTGILPTPAVVNIGNNTNTNSDIHIINSSNSTSCGDSTNHLC